MATIQVFKHGTDLVLGTGTGTINKKQQTAVINSWEKKAGLEVGKEYKLKSEGKTYSDTTCTAINLGPPFATFDNVV